jgi:hypothetical protein
MLRSLVVVALALFAGLAGAKNLYVNNSGTPSCSDATTYAANDASNPWCTIERAAWGSTSAASKNGALAAAAGDVVLITAGTYTPTSANVACGGSVRFNSALNPENSGTAGNLITFQGQGTVNIYLASGYAGPTIGADNRDYIVWDNVRIDEATAVGVSCADTGPVVLHDCTGCKVINSVIKGTTTAFGDNYNGVRTEAAINCVVGGNEIYGFVGNFGHNTSGIMLYDTDSCIFEHNYIHGIENGIYVKGDHAADGLPQQDNVFRFNWIEDSNSECIYLYTAAGTQVYQNITKNCTLHIKLLGDAVNNNIAIVNNTHVTTGTADAAYSLEGDPTTFTNMRWFNNICAGVFAECMNLGALGVNNQSFEHNVYYNYTAHSSVAGAQRTFAVWQGTYGQDSAAPAGITTNPDFVTTSYPGGYKLNVGSPALTQGVDILDLDNDASTTDTVPAGAYITGSEVIGPGGGGLLSAPTNVRFRPRTQFPWLWFAGLF